MNIDRFAEKYESINPYQYTFNNPVRFIDVNGDYVYIDDGDNKYRYENGTTQHKVDGKWVNIDKDVKLSDYARGAIAQVDALSKSGKTGKGLVDYFSGSKYDITIKKGSRNQETNEVVTFNLDDKSLIATTEGVTGSPFHVTLGHELAHRQDKNIRGLEATNKLWYMDGNKRASDSEIYATHIENLIRSESGLPLRTHYGIGISIDNNKTSYFGDEKSRIIDSKGNSRYYGADGKRISPTPSVAKDVDGGEIYKNRFNYNKN